MKTLIYISYHRYTIEITWQKKCDFYEERIWQILANRDFWQIPTKTTSAACMKRQ